jgi:hypothetical protein
MSLIVEPYLRIKVTLDLSELEANDLADSIYEARSSVEDGNWRSDPKILLDLETTIRNQLEADLVRA